HHARKRNCQVITQRQIRFARSFVNAALEYFEDELIPFFAILTHQRFDILDSGRLEWLKPIAAIYIFDHTDDVIAFANVFGEKVAHAARWLCLCRRHYLKTENPA